MLAQSPAVVPARVDSPSCGWPTTAHAESPAWNQPLLLMLRVSASGEVTEVSVRRSSGDAAFNERVLEAARNCRAQPATRDGQPIDSSLSLEVRLRDANAERPSIVAKADCLPAYPVEAVRLGLTGTTVLRFTIDARGEPTRVDVERSSGHAMLDQAATDSLMRCAFRPGRDANGQAVGGSFTVSYVWKLE